MDKRGSLLLWLQTIRWATTIVVVKSAKSKGGSRRVQAANRTAENASAFRSGAVVLVTLNNPREKFWGVLLALNPAGVSVHGIELASFEDATTAVVRGEALASNASFFRMHRVDRIQRDLPEGAIPSLSQRFQARTGHLAADVLLQAGIAVHEGE